MIFLLRIPNQHIVNHLRGFGACRRACRVEQVAAIAANQPHLGKVLIGSAAYPAALSQSVNPIRSFVNTSAVIKEGVSRVASCLHVYTDFSDGQAVIIER